MGRGFDVPVRFLCPPEICVVDVRLRGRVPPTLAITRYAPPVWTP